MKDKLKVGDMVIYDHKSVNPYTGVIKSIETDKWGYQNNVFIHWQGRCPHVYTDLHGFSGFNIRNRPHEFLLIRQ